MRRLLCPLFALALLQAASSQAGPEERLAEAIKFRTISHQDSALMDEEAFRGMKAFLVDTYPRVFSELEVEWVNDYSPLIIWRGSDPEAGAILFTAHTDVVPIEPGTEGDWVHPPFDGVIDDGKVFGRGALDDKVGVISLLEALGSLLAEDYQPRKTVVLAFGHDEEIGGVYGAKALAARMVELGLSFDWMVDEGGLVVEGNPLLPDQPVAMINVAEKGYLTLTLVATGEGGHSSQPPEVSTIGRLARAIDKIERNPLPPRLPEPVRQMFETLAPHMGTTQELFFDNLWLTEGLLARQMAADRSTNAMVRTTTALTMFNAGIKENVVPQRAEAKVNFRLLPGDTAESVIEYVREVVDDPGIEISAAPWNGVPEPASIDGPGFNAISRAVTEVYPDVVVTPSLLTATTDTRHYMEVAGDQYRFHGSRIHVDQAPSIHGSNEFIGVDSFRNTVTVAINMLRYGSE